MQTISNQNQHVQVENVLVRKQRPATSPPYPCLHVRMQCFIPDADTERATSVLPNNMLLCAVFRRSRFTEPSQTGSREAVQP